MSDRLLMSAFSVEQFYKELEAASAKAREQLPELRRAFTKGLNPGEVLLLKAPFATPDGGNEWMWIEVTNWTDEASPIGTLQNKPFDIPDLQSGQEVKIKTAEVFDYIHKKADGTSEGNETGEIIRKMQEK